MLKLLTSSFAKLPDPHLLPHLPTATGWWCGLGGSDNYTDFQVDDAEIRRRLTMRVTGDPDHKPEATEPCGDYFSFDIPAGNRATDIRKAPREDVLKTIGQFSYLTNIARQVAPGKVICMYDRLPILQVAPATMSRADRADWRRANEFLRPVARQLDAICPSLYAYSMDRNAWLALAHLNMTEARQYGLPVIPWIGPMTHPAGKPGGAWVDGDFFALMLETVEELGCETAFLYVMEQADEKQGWYGALKDWQALGIEEPRER